MRRGLALLLAAALLAPALLAPVAAWAVLPSEKLADPALEARARAISEEIRCVVCQNESVDASDADIAHDLRVLIRERLKAGDSDQQVKDYLVARYGDYVLLKPPFASYTLVLWLGPVAVLLLGGLGAAVFLRSQRRRGGPAAVAPLSPEEVARVAELTGRQGEAPEGGVAHGGAAQGGGAAR
ncbi:cytochrome c-type biogenesis protein CcmH [Tistlia consotensis]|uniref:Cytochrome c-type biogenesis protein n=1 Tax=Tistlia consotensis USBA 355 TaxID=560819 RepID=A0A1Y6BPN1_9PROT|nr:cytochrome c-type biogenesis protein [Tistlia consotensis]SMF11802.1 cytochrome c-type biogenesis protein CcmH [Tistlia consotensis USBA 355]SNR51644.1 cytochrome c-type biogenesis protein CcmH [Tistlia consotensis]